MAGGNIVIKKINIGGKGLFPDLIDCKLTYGSKTFDVSGNVNGTVNRTQNVDEHYSKIMITFKPTARAEKYAKEVAGSPNNGSFTASVFDDNDQAYDFVNFGIDNFGSVEFGKDDITLECSADPLLKV